MRDHIYSKSSTRLKNSIQDKFVRFDFRDVSYANNCRCQKCLTSAAMSVYVEANYIPFLALYLIISRLFTRVCGT